MKSRWWALLFIFGAVIYSLVSIFQSAPGYMDADYYAATAIQLAQGKGFSEPFIWNYLNQPSGIPTPSHLYWMPLASIIAAIGVAVRRSTDFLVMKAPFVFLAALLVPLTAYFSRGFLKEKGFAWLGGAAAAFAGLYWVYLTVPETFGLYMLLGAAAIFLIGGTRWFRIAIQKELLLGFLAGVLCGLLHLTRADGILWLVGTLIWIVFTAITQGQKDSTTPILRIAILIFTIIAGYLLIMGAWYLRNLDLFGLLLPPGNSRALWLTDYNQTFDYPASGLNFTNWIDSGIGALLMSRWQALKLNLANLVVVQGSIVFLPLSLAGLFTHRKDSRIQFLAIMWLLTFLVMTLVFPLSGARGGYLHSSAAFQPVLWALVPAGLERFLEWGARKRGWNVRQGFTVFSTGLVVVTILLSGFFYTKRVIGGSLAKPLWSQSDRTYKASGVVLNQLGISEDELGAVNNPPGFFLATGRASIVIPNGDLDHLRAAAQAYHATYLILEPGQVNLTDLYQHPGDHVGLDYLGNSGNAQIYRIVPDE